MLLTLSESEARDRSTGAVALAGVTLIQIKGKEGGKVLRGDHTAVETERMQEQVDVGNLAPGRLLVDCWEPAARGSAAVERNRELAVYAPQRCFEATTPSSTFSRSSPTSVCCCCMLA
jgi:hypothetical protein